MFSRRFFIIKVLKQTRSLKSFLSRKFHGVPFSKTITQAKGDESASEITIV